MIKYRSWVTALVVLVGLAFAGEPAIQTVDLGNLADATGDASSGQPTAEELQAVADHGYVAVIDLRGDDEDRGFDEAAAATAVGLSYATLPIADEAAVNVDNARKLGELLAVFDGPVLVHCGSGNRVGALTALLAAEAGADVDQALEAGRAAGLTRLEGMVRKQLETAEAP